MERVRERVGGVGELVVYVVVIVGEVVLNE